MKNKLISLVCIISILVWCFPIVSIQASNDSTDIINACFLPYEQQISVLASVPQGYNVRMYVSGSEIGFTSSQSGEYILYTSDNFTPVAYGVVPVTLEATNGTKVLSDTQNIRIFKSFSNSVSLEENFDSLEPVSMSDTADDSVANAVNSLNSKKITLSAIPALSYSGRYADITDTYTSDNSSALTMRFHTSADKGLPTLSMNPDADGTSGITELSYDFITTNPYIRQTIFPVSKAHSSDLTFVTQDGASFASSFRVVNYETFCFGSSDKKVMTDKLYNIRFLLNLNELKFEFYVDGELINYGDFTYNNSAIGRYIYAIDYFNIAAGVQGKAGASENKPVNISFDNLRITHTDIGAAADKIAYTVAGDSENTDILNANIAPDADSIRLGFNNALLCSRDDITLQTESGSIIEAEILHTDGEGLSAKASRSNIIIIPKDSLSVGKNYKIILSENIKYGSAVYGLTTEIPFKADGEMPLPAIASVSGEEKYYDGELICADVNSFELEISNAGYANSESLAENFSFLANGKALDVSNVVLSGDKLSFDVSSLPQNADLEFVIGSETLLYDGVTKTGTDAVFTLKTADSNGLYFRKHINSGDTETKVFFELDSLGEKTVMLVVSAYNYNKLVSVITKDVTVTDAENISFTLSNDGVTHVKALIWDSTNTIAPLAEHSYTTTGNSNPLGLLSVFEPDSRAYGYIGDAVIFKDDVDSMVYNKQKYRYEDLTKAYPYTSDNGTFMIPADLFSLTFETQISTEGNEITVGTDAVTVLGSSVMNTGGAEYTLDNPFEVKNGVLYVPVRSVAQDILGKSYMLDRGMHIFDDEDFKYTNSVSTYETKEPIDSIYRLLQFEHKKSTDIYEMMDSYLGGNVHPRILTDGASLASIKSDSLTDPVVSGALTNTLSEADKYLTTKVQEYVIPDGVRLLVAARNVMERLVTLSAAYLVSDNTAYADRAWLEIENCFAWPDWNTDKHYLDNSELLYGVAVAFDSFYDYFTDEQKQLILDKTWELSLKHTVDRYQGINFSGSEWRTARSNWGFVCNGAVITAVLAFGREGNYNYQPYYDYLLECALQAIEYPLMLYYPDGAWEEGLAYWEYSLRYFTTSVLVPLYYSTGSTLDFMKPQGVSKLADMGLYMQSGNFAFNFSDNGSEDKRPCESVYAFAMLTDDDTLMQTWNYEMNSMNATHSARTLMWYRPSENGNQSSASELSLDSFFRDVEAGSMKEQWYDTDASVVFFKGGQNNSGSHLDVGTFCFDTMGKRWSVDPGKDSYNIEGGYNGLAGCELYVKRPEGHNCVVINPRADVEGEYYGGQYLNGRAEITSMQSGETEAFATVDLSDAYKYDTDSYIRAFYLGDNRRTLVVQDEINLIEDNSSIYWFMHTRASIEIDPDGKGAYLSHGNKRLRVDMLTNAADAKFVINSVGPDIQRFPTDPIREGQLQGGSFTNIKVLTIEATGSGDVYITVKLSPVDEDFDTYKDISYTPISEWVIS